MPENRNMDLQHRVSSAAPAHMRQRLRTGPTLTNGVPPGRINGWKLVGEGAAITEIMAGGTEQDAVVHPIVDAHAHAQRLTLVHAEEGAVLNKHHQALTRTGHLQKRLWVSVEGGARMLTASISRTL